MPCQRDPSRPAPAGGLLTSTAYRPAFTNDPGLITPTAWWLSRRCGCATTAGNPIASHRCPARVVTSRPHRTGCRHTGTAHPGSVTTSNATSSS
jgi:hypothetical protein